MKWRRVARGSLVAIPFAVASVGWIGAWALALVGALFAVVLVAIARGQA